ncbi:MAG: hypothetical protein CMLOHMNK_03020 [Steroidobacteraceae bacterium]|nr:hypothetical protein [Steroidobacteraceae bacterium]
MNAVPRIVELASELCESRGDDLLRYLRRRLRNRSDASDIAQEAYLRFIRLAKAEQIRNPEAYLFRIAGNLLWEHQLRERNLIGQVESDEQPVTEETPLDLAVAGEEARRLGIVLEELPATRRAVLVLHLRDELTCAQIASQVGVSVSMIKKHLKLALTFCRMRLRELEQDRVR